MKSVKLVPFDTLKFIKDFNVNFFRMNNSYEITYEIEGDISKIILPHSKEIQLKRKSNLWEKTCFEFFIKEKSSKQYLEFNFSPTGEWNCYLFDSYRFGMREYSNCEIQNIIFEKLANKIVLKVLLEIQKLPEQFIDNNALYFSLASVLEHKNNHSYWSHIHVGERPDFHEAKNFNLKFN